MSLKFFGLVYFLNQKSLFHYLYLKLITQGATRATQPSFFLNTPSGLVGLNLTLNKYQFFFHKCFC